MAFFGGGGWGEAEGKWWLASLKTNQKIFFKKRCHKPESDEFELTPTPGSVIRTGKEMAPEMPTLSFLVEATRPWSGEVNE